MRGIIYGQKAVVKESASIPFLSRAVPWTDAPEKRPAKVVEKNKEFARAVEKCKDQPKYKGGNVWGVSKFNRCISEALKA